MNSSSIQIQFGNAAAFSGDLCLQVHRPRPVGPCSAKGTDEVATAP
jgi:hypothetical protein